MIQNEIGETYGHHIKRFQRHEMVHFDGAVIADGGDTRGALYRMWQKMSDDFNHNVASAITHSRWLEIKRCLKLCDNKVAPKRNQEGYNPAYKYERIWDTFVHNTNAVTEFAESDLCGGK